MTPDEIKSVRQTLGLSTREFETLLGYDADGRVCQALEAGARNGKPFIITGAGLKSLQYLLAIKHAYDAIRAEKPLWAGRVLAGVLPPKLR